MKVVEITLAVEVPDEVGEWERLKGMVTNIREYVSNSVSEVIGEAQVTSLVIDDVADDDDI